MIQKDKSRQGEPKKSFRFGYNKRLGCFEFEILDPDIYPCLWTDPKSQKTLKIMKSKAGSICMNKFP